MMTCRSMGSPPRIHIDPRGIQATCHSVLRLSCVEPARAKTWFSSKVCLLPSVPTLWASCTTRIDATSPADTNAEGPTRLRTLGPALMGWRFYTYGMCAFGGCLLSLLIAHAYRDITSLCNTPSRAVSTCSQGLQGLSAGEPRTWPCCLPALVPGCVYLQTTASLCDRRDHDRTEPLKRNARARACNGSQGAATACCSTNAVLSEVALGGVRNTTLVDNQPCHPLRQRAAIQGGRSTAVHTHACAFTTTDGQVGEAGAAAGEHMHAL